jgi:cytochrome c556
MRKAASIGLSGLLVITSLSCSASNQAPVAPEAASSDGTTSDGSASDVATSASSTANSVSTASPAESDPGALDIPPYKASPNRIMQAHFKDALLIRNAIVSGKPEDAANPATVILAAQNLDNLPNGWQPFVVDMQAVAQRIVNGTTAPAVAAAAADLGLSCGACHSKFGGPPPSNNPAPADDGSFAVRMQRHGWATERLWEALATPSESSWEVGAATLMSSPFSKEKLASASIDVRTAASDFAKLTAAAPSKKTPAARAALYAELLLTCGACHQAASEPR